jgi:dephospho-CoA kinase
MIILGLTGSIGMGKSTTAKMFAAAGIPVHDSDATVHALYSGAAVPLIEAAFPGTTSDGVVDRVELGKRVFGQPDEIGRLEAIVHPLVQAAEAAFIAEARQASQPVVLLDIPLLFETGGAARVDKVVVVTAPQDVQRVRVLARGVSEERLAQIRARQMPDADKRARADFIIDTGRGLADAEAQVRAILAELAAEGGISEAASPRID